MNVVFDMVNKIHELREKYMDNQVGIVKVNGQQITIGGSSEVVHAVRTLASFGLITFSRQMRFKSSEYLVIFFKPTAEMRSMYNLGNELLTVCCSDGMNDFKSRTKILLILCWLQIQNLRIVLIKLHVL